MLIRFSPCSAASQQKLGLFWLHRRSPSLAIKCMPPPDSALPPPALFGLEGIARNACARCRRLLTMPIHGAAMVRRRCRRRPCRGATNCPALPDGAELGQQPAPCHSWKTILFAERPGSGAIGSFPADSSRRSQVRRRGRSAPRPSHRHRDGGRAARGHSERPSCEAGASYDRLVRLASPVTRHQQAGRIIAMTTASASSAGQSSLYSSSIQKG